MSVKIKLACDNGEKAQAKGQFALAFTVSDKGDKAKTEIIAGGSANADMMEALGETVVSAIAHIGEQEPAHAARFIIGIMNGMNERFSLDEEED